MIEATFNTKGNQTKQVQKILGEGFKVRTNATCTIVKGDVEAAKEMLAGYAMFFGFCEMGDNLAVWAK